MGFSIIGTGSAVPKRVVTNEELSHMVDTSDEWIRERTGIHARRVCVEETMSDLTEQAAKAALENAGKRADEIDFVICSTIRGDFITPAQACVITERIGARCPAFDVNAACSGFVYALSVADGLMAAGRAKRILIVSTETMSRLVDWKDRATCVLFGDGAGAVLLEQSDQGGLMALRLGGKPNHAVLNIPNTMGDSPFSDIKNGPSVVHMNGQEVYKFAVSTMCRDVKKLVEEANISFDDITYMLPHQANMRIIDGARERLPVDRSKYVSMIEDHGNISSACIPLMIDRLNRDKKLKSGDILAMSTFGAGLTSGACLLRWA